MAAIAFDFGGTRLKAGLISNGRVLDEREYDVADNSRIVQLLPWMSSTIENMLSATKNEDVAGIGMAYPGVVDSKNMQVLSRYVKYADVHDFDFVAWTNSQWGLPFAMENDARAALLGEWQYGAGQGCNHILMVTLGTGIGTAVLMDGVLLRGSHYLAGNLGGHISIDYRGRDCNCGFVGCLESVASTWALPDIIQESEGYQDSSLLGQKLNFKTLFEHAETDEFASRILTNCLDAWGVGMTNLVHAFDPEMIILSGGIMRAGDKLLTPLKKRIKTNSWIRAGDISIVKADQPDFSGVLGVAYLVENLQTELKKSL